MGTSYGASTELEIELAEKVVSAIPSVEIVRMVNSGTEAVMSALRLARGITGRDKIVKFEGCYHGHGDSLLVKAGSGLVSLGIPECPGIVSSLAEKTLNLSYNDVEGVRDLFQREGKDIAALIVEPIAGNMGVIPPRPGFLQTLRDETKKAGALLIFDEVISGLRVSLGGAQKLFGITPDITCMGKIIGGGLPVGAQFTRVGSMFSMFFTDQQITNFESVKTCDTNFFKNYFNAMLEEGIYIAPSQFEAGFMSAIHSDKEIDQTIDANLKALKVASR